MSQDFKVTVAKRFTIDAAHRLQGVPKCHNLHGHRYEISVSFSGYPEVDGMVINFDAITETVGEWLNRSWDHAYLHRLDDEIGKVASDMGLKTYAFIKSPTAETMCQELQRVVAGFLAEESSPINGLVLKKIIVQETPTSWAEI